nr:MAG TPA: hypothetical protein [Caudoviricetes sp.]
MTPRKRFVILEGGGVTSPASSSLASQGEESGLL